MTELGPNMFFNVSESGSHLRCCATRDKSSSNSDLFIRYQLMFLESSLELLLLVMHGTVTLIPPIIPDSTYEVLRTVMKLELFSIYSSSMGSRLEIIIFRH